MSKHAITAVSDRDSNPKASSASGVKHMKILILLFILFSVYSYAEEECTFNSDAFNNFKDNYIHNNSNAQFDDKTNQLLVRRDNKTIYVNGGGCFHLGVKIEVQTDTNLSEKDFLVRVFNLSREFGHWLINTDSLKKSLDNKNWEKNEDIYYINVDDMTVFEASHINGTIAIRFYIN